MVEQEQQNCRNRPGALSTTRTCMNNKQKESTEQSNQMAMEPTARFGDIVPGEHPRLRP